MDASDIKNMFDGLSTEWKDILVKTLKQEFKTVFDGINSFLTENRKTKDILCPEPRDIFNAFRLTKFNDLKVVLLGQDPYINKHEAMGLSFSVPKGVKNPPSVKTIYECLIHNKLMDVVPDGDLSNWAKQGVLLINAALTTIVGKSNAHAHLWSDYIDKVISEIDKKCKGVIFILLGGFAQKKERLISKNHFVLKWGHPSPLNMSNKTDNPNHFRYCDVFTKSNEILKQLNKRVIVWDPAKKIEVVKEPEYVVKRIINDNDPIPVDDKIYLFTDGGSTANGKENCKASYAYYLTDGCDIVEGYGLVDDAEIIGEEYKSSNNRGELNALLNGLKQLTNGEFKITNEVIVVSDSKYSLQSIDIWSRSWLEDPVKHKLKEKKNLDLILPAKDIIDQLRSTGVVIRLAHMNSHMNEPGDTESESWFYWKCNDIVDKLCSTQLNRA